MKLVLHRTSTGNGSQALRRGRESQRCDDRYLRKEPHRSCLKRALQSRLLKRMATRGALERFKFPPVVKTLRARARFGKPKTNTQRAHAKARPALHFIEPPPAARTHAQPLPGRMPRASGARAGTHRSTISARRKMDPGSRDARPGNVDSCALIHARKSQRILHPSPAWRLFGSRPTPSNAEDAERTRRRNEAVTPSLFSLVRKTKARAPATGWSVAARRPGTEARR